MKWSFSKKITVSLVFLICLTSVWFAVRWQSDRKAEQEEQTLSELMPGPPAGGDFTLQSADGPVSLRDMRGKVVLLFFGYTSCPTACPTSLDIMAEAFSRMSVEELSYVRGIFISFDPERDTVEKIKEYAGYFHPNIIGLTDKPEVIKEVTKKYGAYFIKSVEKESAMEYTFAHSTNIYVIAPDGSLREILSGTSPPEAIVGAVRRIVGFAR